LPERAFHSGKQATAFSATLLIDVVVPMTVIAMLCASMFL